MNPHATVLLQALQQHQESFCQAIVQNARDQNPDGQGPGYKESDLVQMVQGFFALISESLEEREPVVRAFYMDSVLPGLRDTGTELSKMIGGTAETMTSLIGTVMCEVPLESRAFSVKWLSKFTGSYLHDIALVWEKGKGSV